MEGWRSRLAWTLALAVGLAAAPWPGWSPSWAALAVAAAVLSLWARPSERRWLPAAVAWLAAFVALPHSIRPLNEVTATADLDRHCQQMRLVAEELAADADLVDIFAASGESVDPAFPFRRLERAAGSRAGRTVYLADDRGRLVAWGGLGRAYPPGLRPLGDRRWSLAWSVGEVALVLREPVMVGGRPVGAVTVVDRSPVATESAFGLRAAPASELWLAARPGHWRLLPPSAVGVALPIGMRPSAAAPGRAWPRWLPLLAVAVLAAVARPGFATLVVLVAAAGAVTLNGRAGSPQLAVAAVLAAAAVHRWLVAPERRHPRRAAAVALAVAVAVGLLLARPGPGCWLPDRLLHPGWGGVWVCVTAWLGRALAPRSWSLGQRLLTAAVVAALALALTAVTLPVDLAAAAARADAEAVAPGDWPGLAEILPASPNETSLDDLAAVMAARWELAVRAVPSELVAIVGGAEVSRWGDLGLAGASRVAATWPLGDGPDDRLELREAVAPWRWLADWPAAVTRGRRGSEALGFAVLTRSGEVEASLEERLGGLDPARAGDLYHRGGGYAALPVGEGLHLARFDRRDGRLRAVVALHPQPGEVVVRLVVAALLAFLALAVASPPRLAPGDLTTFGGRLRLLVAAGVVLPLALLTGLLQLQFERAERQREQSAGRDALHSARYTAVHLAGGLAVDDELARWIADGWWGEVALFDGAGLVAASRRDLMRAGTLPELPAPAAFTSYQLGREDTLVWRHRQHLVAAGVIDLEGRRLLLELYRPEPREDVEAPGTADWLLAGAALAALVALVLIGRVERRLSLSLEELVALARRLLLGQPLGVTRRPVERDLAEVLDAVRSMSAEVQRRETALRRQEELLRITLATLAPAVVVVDPGGAVRFANPAAERLLDSSGGAVLDIVRALAARGVGETEPGVETVSPRPGTDVTWRVGLARAPLPHGEVGLVAVVDDVSELVRADRVRQLNQLARIVAHEVKNPLTPIRLWVQELEEARRRGAPDLDALVGEACGEIGAQVERLQETASSFSNLVALERWEPLAVDLADLVRAALAGLGVLKRRGVEVVLELPAPGACTVTGDPTWLQRALGNLVHNSVTAIGDRPGSVRVRVVARDGWAALEVEDSGGGVADGSLDSLFSPHFSTTTGGSGLGLALVANVVARCHGRVSAANGADGLVVRLELPLAG